MVEPLEIAEAAHRICEINLIPKGVSPPHDMLKHIFASGIYARHINEAGLKVSGDDVIMAILQVTKWDGLSKWPGHPDYQKVIEYLKSNPPSFNG